MDLHEQKKLRIAVVIKNFISTGGAERYAVEVARRIKDRGHCVDLYARQIDPDLACGMTMVRVPDRFRFSSVISLWDFARLTRAMVKDRGYDIVHSHDKGCQAQVSTVHTFSFKRGMESMSLAKKINEFVISPRAWLYLHLERKQAESACLAAVSDIIREDIQTCHQRFHGVQVIPPGVDVEKFSPETVQALRERCRAEAGLDPGDLAVVFIGSEFRRKGLDRLIPAIDPGMHLFVVGRGERLSHYRKQAADLGLAVTFTGLTDRVLHYYALADVVVLPSKAEAFGMTVLEGMACGLPVIVSQEAGCSCLVTSGDNGLVFDAASDLAGMLEMLRSESLRRELGKRAREKALTCTWEHTADRYEQLYMALAMAGQGCLNQ